MLEKTIIPLYIRKPEIEDYLRYIFNAPSTGPIAIHRGSDAGRYIYSRVKYSKPNAEKELTEIEIHVELPIYRTSIDRSRVAFFSRDDMDKINDFLQADFNLTFRAFMLAGEEMGIDKKDLLESFISGTGIRHVGRKFDSLKKKDYRHRKKIFRILVSSLQSIGFKDDV